MAKHLPPNIVAHQQPTNPAREVVRRTTQGGVVLREVFEKLPKRRGVRTSSQAGGALFVELPKNNLLGASWVAMNPSKDKLNQSTMCLEKKACKRQTPNQNSEVSKQFAMEFVPLHLKQLLNLHKFTCTYAFRFPCFTQGFASLAQGLRRVRKHKVHRTQNIRQ